MWRVGEHKVRFWMMVCFSLQLFGADPINQKMILSAHLQTKDAAQSLYRAEKFFQENSNAHALKDQYHLTLGLELLEPYVAVSIKPIGALEVKNKLRYLLQASFPQNFVVDDTPVFTKIQPKTPVVQSPAQANQPIKPKENIVTVDEKTTDRYARVKRFFQTMQSEWFGLLFLALAGFMLVARSARQMSKIRSLQEQVSKYQSKVEGEIHTMGEQRG
jgi:hypothetical protein